MYKSYVYLEIRVLLSAVPGVFILESDSNKKMDILTVKEEYVQRNNEGHKLSGVSIQPSVLHKVSSLVHSLGGNFINNPDLEKLTGNIQDPPDDKEYTGFSVKIAEGGTLPIMFHQRSKNIRIEEIRIEENCGHLTRTGGTAHMDWTYAGCPCMRIKTCSSFEVGEEAEVFLQELYTLMAYLKLTVGELGESSVRCNAYVALADYPNKPDYIVKLRNLNSFNFVRSAINSEVTRQENILVSGAEVKSESRLWIAERKITESWQERSISKPKFKTYAPDIKLDISAYADPKDMNVELPEARRTRLRSNYGLSKLRAQFICGEKDRADFFEEAVAHGAEPLLAARWIASELTKLLNTHNISIKQSKITAKKFAEILMLLREEKIHSGMAKDLLFEVFKTGDDIQNIIRTQNLVLLSSEEELSPIIDKVLAENTRSVTALKKGEMAPLDFLTGAIMKETNGQAHPATVKALIKEKLNISLIYILTMGGAITARMREDGTIAAADSTETISNLLDNNVQLPYLVKEVSSMLSEETEPEDWAKLICSVKSCMESGTANGIVITHGTDTLPYTAALIYWLFSSADVPVVFTASSTLPSESTEARDNLNFAMKTAMEKKKGVYVACSGKLYSPLNLRFMNTKENLFVNWNLKEKIYSSQSLVSSTFMSISAPEKIIISHILNEAARKMIVLRLYPGLPCTHLELLISRESDIRTVIAETYASGTGNMRNSDYSLKDFLLRGKKRGLNVYCTSQQESIVDFSSYSTSAQLWREGLVPMGFLTTESTVALYFALNLIADSERELAELMEVTLNE